MSFHGIHSVPEGEMNGQLKLQVGQPTHTGMRRTANEDSFAVPEAIDPQPAGKERDALHHRRRR